MKTLLKGTSLVVQWLRLHASNAEGMGSIPGWGTKIPHAIRGVANKQTNKTTLLKTLQWLHTSLIIKYTLLCMAYRCLHDLGPY